MSEEKIESAVQRIEAALARIAEVADQEGTANPPVSALVVKHESLLETMGITLNELDHLIGELEQ